MRELLIAFLKRTPLYFPVKNWAEKRLQEKKYMEWDRNGRSVPPPHFVKQRLLKNIAKASGLTILVETGTYRGDMIEATRKSFDKVYSIELSKELYEAARERFRGEKNIELLHGDSGKVLGELVNRIDQPALFWLDGHFSDGVTARGDEVTPVYEELMHIFKAWGRGHGVVIDDARLFGADPAYPSMDELIAFIESKKPGVSIVVKDDSIRITQDKRPV